MCSRLCQGACLSVRQMLTIWTVERIVLIRKKYFKIHLKQKLIMEEKDSCLLILFSFFIKPLSLVLQKNFFEHVCNVPSHTRASSIHADFFTVSQFQIKTAPNRFSEITKSNSISSIIIPNMLWIFGKSSMENFWGWVLRLGGFFLITKPKQTLIWFG